MTGLLTRCPPRLLAARHFSTAVTARKQDGPPPMSNQPASKAREARGNETPSRDPQNNASNQEHKSGDERPAKQPDPQEQPSRSTGFGAQSEVAGGKKAKEGESRSG